MFGKHEKHVCYGNVAPVEMVKVKIVDQPLHPVLILRPFMISTFTTTHRCARASTVS